MDYLKISESLKAELQPKLKKAFPTRRPYFAINHWHANRFILLPTILNDDDIHYEYYQGHVELHLEGKFSGSDYNTIWHQLVDISSKYDLLSWHRWCNRNQGRCRLNAIIQSADDIVDCFRELSKIFDPILQPLLDGDKETIMEQLEVQESLPSADKMIVDALTYSIINLKDLPFDNFIIPEYQRPYKWNTKNVNQLINDLITFRKSKEYRLGTLVLNENAIVDGQQRIVSLSLLFHTLFSKSTIKEDNPYQEFQDKIKFFWKRTKFDNDYSIAHVRENLSAIEERMDDFDNDFLDFLLNNCQFVVVQLPKISEAFQFFDSQNARGKDLEPHDLLKAFHLREITNLSQRDNDNITSWQAHKTKHLVNLFVALYRVKMWSRANKGREFTKDDVDVFKGISLHGKRFPYFMQQIICHYFSDSYANDISRQIDQSNWEFPFQLDQVCINGSRFFDAIRHYDELYNKVTHSKTFLVFDTEKDNKSAYKIIHRLNNYGNRFRKGDIYTRQLFDCLLLYYIDRFGFVEINKIVKKFFRYAYTIRLRHFSVQLSTIDNEAIGGAMFRTIRDAKTPYEIINKSIDFVKKEDVATNADSEIKELYY